MENGNRAGRSLILLVLVIAVMGTVLTFVTHVFDNKAVSKTEEEAFKVNVYEYCLRLEEYKKNAYETGIDTEELEVCGVKLKGIIPEIIETDMSKFKVSQGKLVYIGMDARERKWTEEIDI